MKLSTEAKVGAVSLTGIILLAYIIVHLSGFSWNNKGYSFQVAFHQVAGLKPGNGIRFAGVDVGRIQSVKVLSGKVQVELGIDAGVQIPIGSHIGIGTDGFLGEKFVDISPPDQITGFIEPGALVQGEGGQGMDRLIAGASEALEQFQLLVRSMNDIIADEKVRASLKATAINAGEITANLNAMSAALARMASNNEQDVNSMVSNLAVMAQNLRQVAGRVDGMVENLDNRGQTAADVREMIANLKSTSQKVEKMTTTLEGLVTDPETSKNIKETLRNVRSASEKADKLLNQVGNIKTQAGVEIGYNGEEKNYRTGLDLRVTTTPNDFAILGVKNDKEGNTFDVQMGKGNENHAVRVGMMESKPGIGLDSKVSEHLKMSLDVYDPNDVRVKLRAQYQMAPDTFLFGESQLNKKREENTFFGVRKTF